MESADLPEIVLCDKNRVRVGIIGADEWDRCEVRLKHLGISTATLSLSWDSVIDRPELVAQGARLIINHRGNTLLSGPIVGIAGEGPTAGGGLTLTVESDTRLLWRWLMWPDPAAAITSQPAYWRRNAPLETVLVSAVTGNRDRMGPHVVTGTNPGRGPTVIVRARFDLIADKLLPLFEGSGLGVDLVQDPYPSTDIRLRRYETRTYPYALTEASGVLAGWSWNVTGPAATRGVIGGAGEGSARRFLASSQTAMEAAWGDKAETFVDARDMQLDAEDPDMDTLGDLDVAMYERLRERFMETAPMAGMSVTLTETENFKVDPTTGPWLGDTVTAETLAGINHTEIVREIVCAWTPDDGFTATPAVGQTDNSPLSPLVRGFATLARRFRAQATR